MILITKLYSHSEKIRKDMENFKIMTQVKAMAYVGHMITGPWMRELYTYISYIYLYIQTNILQVPYIKEAVDMIERWSINPEDLLKSNIDIFGEILTTKKCEPNNEEERDLIYVILKAVLSAIAKASMKI